MYDTDFGLVGDNVTDDTAALNAMVADAYAKAAAGSPAVRLIFRALPYLLSTAPTCPQGAGGPYAQIPLARIALNQPRVNIEFVGATGGPHTPNEAQTVIENAGTIFRSTATGTLNGIANAGLPSVIGGPACGESVTQQQTNLAITLTNITVRQPDNPSIAGVDFYWCEQAKTSNLVVDTNVPLGSVSTPTHPTGIGAVMPTTNNNALSTMEGDTFILGHYAALVGGEHLHVKHLVTYKNIISFVPGTSYHAIRIDHFNAEWQQYVFAALDLTTGVVGLPQCFISCGVISIEDANATAPTFQNVTHILNTSGVARIGGDYVRWNNGALIPGLTTANAAGVFLRDLGTGQATGIWIAPTFVGAWTNFGNAQYADAAYRLVDGYVELRGFIVGGATATEAFNLPAGYRPALNKVLPVAAYPSGANAFLDIQGAVGSGTPGDLSVLYSGALTALSLDGARFQAEQ